MKNKRIFKLFLVCIIIFLTLISFSFVEVKKTKADSPFAGGSGIDRDPYQITNCFQLQAMKDHLSSSFVLNNNIDCSMTSGWNNGLGFLPIGHFQDNFSGSLNGNNYVISDLFINKNDSYAGLFAFTFEAIISNIGLINVNFTSGDDFVGGLAGRVEDSEISNVYTSGIIAGSQSVGGIIGDIKASNILNSYSTVQVSAESNYAGGIAGYVDSTSKINNSYSTGDVSGSNFVGGLVGNTSAGVIVNSYWYNHSGNPDVCVGYYDIEPESSECGAIYNVSDLYSSNALVYAQGQENQWDFGNIWLTRNDNLPILAGQGGDNETEFYTLSYLSSAGGTLSGSTSQIVSAGSDGSAITAVPNNGYIFVRWSDNSTANPRTDLNVLGDISVSAIFERIASGSNTPSMPAGIGDGSRDATVSAGNIFGSIINVGQIDNSGVNVLTYVTNKNNFSAPQSSNNWQYHNHSFEIKLLDLLKKKTTLIFRSEPVTVDLNLGETKYVDLDKDGINDIKVTFTDIYVNRAEITIKSLSNQTISQPSSETETIIIANNDLYNKLKGKILLKVEDNGRAYYVSPTKKEMYYLGRPADAFRIMREQGIGITNNDLNKILVSGQKADKNIVPSFAKNHSGKIFLQVQNNGEAWYIDTVNNNRHYLGRPNDAFQIMRNLSLGISNVDFVKLSK